MVRHGGAGGLHDTIGVHILMLSDGLLQGGVAVAVLAVDFEPGKIDRQFPQREAAHAAGSQVVAGAALGLGPVHIFRLLVSHARRRLQNQYTGIPASMIPSAMALLPGLAATALPTIAAQHKTKSAVVSGWPGAR